MKIRQISGRVLTGSNKVSSEDIVRNGSDGLSVVHWDAVVSEVVGPSIRKSSFVELGNGGNKVRKLKSSPYYFPYFLSTGKSRLP